MPSDLNLIAMTTFRLRTEMFGCGDMTLYEYVLQKCDQNVREVTDKKCEHVMLNYYAN
jgi:hypothetical protein